MGFVIVALVALGGFFASIKHHEGMKKAWKAAALSLDMEIDMGGALSSPKIRGRVGDVSVLVDTHKSNNENHCTRYRITYPPAGPPVRIKRQGPLHKVSRFFGSQDMEIGDPRFDDEVVVDTGQPEQMRMFLTPSRQAAVLAVFNGWNRAEVTHGEIKVETNKFEQNTATIVRTVTQLVAIAQVMGHPLEVDAALGMQLQGDLGLAIDELHSINERNPNVFTQMLEAEALIEHGDHERASEVIAPAWTAGGSEADGWKRLADAPSPVVLPAPAQEAVATTDLSQRDVIDDLFGGHLMSFEIVERFEAQYMNKRVGWTGTVTQVHTYRHDNDFGEGPGVKATLLLGASGSGSVISNEVHAVVQLGADTQLDRDSEVSFVATLLHVDRFARKLYLSRGALT